MSIRITTAFDPAKTLAIAIATIFVGISAASGAELTGFAQTTIKYSDLSMSSPGGATALYGRIKSAAEGVCSNLAGRNLSEVARFERCVATAISSAVAKVGSEQLNAVFAARHGATASAKLASL